MNKKNKIDKTYYRKIPIDKNYLHIQNTIMMSYAFGFYRTYYGSFASITAKYFYRNFLISKKLNIPIEEMKKSLMSFFSNMLDTEFKNVEITSQEPQMLKKENQIIIKDIE